MLEKKLSKLHKQLGDELFLDEINKRLKDHNNQNDMCKSIGVSVNSFTLYMKRHGFYKLVTWGTDNEKS